MKENPIRLIENFKSLRVLVIGDAILDTYIITTPEKFGREAPVPVFNIQDTKHQCGGAANTAINIAALGAKSYFLTVTGRDSVARRLCGMLKKNKVHIEDIIKDRSRTTISKKRVTASSNILFRVDSGTTTLINEQSEKELLDRLYKLYRYIDVIIISDYECGVITHTLINAIKELGNDRYIPIIVDAKDLTKYKTLRPEAVKPNYEEVLSILHLEKVLANNRVQQILENEKDLFEITGAHKIAATCDTDGVVFFEKGKSPYHISSVPCDDKKSIGAGDTFTSALALSLASGVSGSTAADIAAAAATVIMQKDGTAWCTNNELKNYFNEVPKHILTKEGLTAIIKELKQNGRKIVFTNGCFDILHTGHIFLLNNARKAGDVLIVGVNSDASIRKIKGPGRPINNFNDRIIVLAGLQSIDYLISFDEESPVNLIKSIHPGVFVKGGNYTENSIPEAPLLKKLGCIIKIIPYLEEHSTTHIIDRILDTRHETEIALNDY
ncbi:MAG TPA: D-glycero-beta-D-manno-heptose 1-phosphate adenylyltransferase [Chitinophagaceae bacterium]|jgi:D-beta-D-heptose 7-phosphate kinase/D-beta-D-heptose 1-phosphate adenosyltransferase